MINEKSKMIEGFDQEVDALLRQTARGETVSENSKFKIQNSVLPHLDADEISLFAENALSERLRQTAVAHFADCDRCRRILSDLITENAQKEKVPAAQIELFPAPIPWHRKLFAFPNLAYALGALVVAFSGIIGYTVLQTVKNSQNAEVSQVSERQLNGKGMSADGDATIVETPNSGAMMANSMSNAAMSNAAMSNSAMSSVANSATSKNSTNSAAKNSAANSTADAPTEAKPASPAANLNPASVQTDRITSSQVSELPLNGRSSNNLTQLPEAVKKENAKTAETADSVAAPAPESDKSASDDNKVVISAGASAEDSKKSRAMSLSAKKTAVQDKDKKSSERRQTGGKTFERKNNIWIDSAYKNQPTVNVSRGTEIFIRLDAGLRSIADNLGGTIIVVWKNKAYRIQ